MFWDSQILIVFPSFCQKSSWIPRSSDSWRRRCFTRREGFRLLSCCPMISVRNQEIFYFIHFMLLLLSHNYLLILLIMPRFISFNSCLVLSHLMFHVRISHLILLSSHLIVSWVSSDGGASSDDFRGPEESDELDYLPSRHHWRTGFYRLVWLYDVNQSAQIWVVRGKLSNRTKDDQAVNSLPLFITIFAE